MASDGGSSGIMSEICIRAKQEQRSTPDVAIVVEDELHRNASACTIGPRFPTPTDMYSSGGILSPSLRKQIVSTMEDLTGRCACCHFISKEVGSAVGIDSTVLLRCRLYSQAWCHQCDGSFYQLFTEADTTRTICYQCPAATR